MLNSDVTELAFTLTVGSDSIDIGIEYFLNKYQKRTEGKVNSVDIHFNLGGVNSALVDLGQIRTTDLDEMYFVSTDGRMIATYLPADHIWRNAWAVPFLVPYQSAAMIIPMFTVSFNGEYRVFSDEAIQKAIERGCKEQSDLSATKDILRTNDLVTVLQTLAGVNNAVSRLTIRICFLI